MREAAEREIAELRAVRRHLEHRVVNANRTLAYGLGRALIEARSFKGLLALPRRLWRLRLKQRAKRRARVPDTLPSGAAAHLRLVDEALERARNHGAAAAAQWLRGQRGGDPARARAMIELALAETPNDPGFAGSLGIEAARLSPNEPRLPALIVSLDGAGLVRAPAAIGAAIDGNQPLSQGQRALAARLSADRRILEEGIADMPGEVRTLSPDRAPRVELLCPDRWRGSARIAGCAAGAGEAALDAVIFSVEGEPDLEGPPPALFHIFPRTLTEAERALRTALRAGAPAVVDLGGVPAAILRHPESEAAEAVRRRLGWIAAHAQQLAVRGPGTADALAALGIEAASFADAPAGEAPAAEDIEAARREFGLEAGGPVIACIGRPDAGLIEAFAELKASGDAAQLAVIGAGGAALAREALRCGIADAVSFLGNPLPLRAAALLGAVDLAVFPGSGAPALDSETPMWLAEAAAHGVRRLAGEVGAGALRSALSDPPSAPEPPPASDFAPLYRELAALR